MPIGPNSRLGKYLIRDRIGAGGMGVVYRARDMILGREVAIKTVLPHMATDRDFVTRFTREAFAISRIAHPHIVQLLDFVEANPANDQPAFMVMEYLEGHDLGWVITNEGPLAITRAIDRTLEVCAAVGECHRLGYIHRDLTPRNIFLASYNQIETAKVLDFGTTKSDERRDGDGEESELTKKGTLLGTPIYMAPELIAGNLATPKADQYALAVVLYTALAGVRPFEVDKKREFKEVEMLQAITKGEYKPLRSHRGEVPEGLADVIAKAMQVWPASRYDDLHAFGAAIRRWASPQSSLIWEAHFTSSAPLRRSLQVSIAIGSPFESSGAHAEQPKGSVIDDATSVDSTVPPQEALHATNPTVRSRRDAAGEISLATTAVQDPNNPPSISIEFHDPDRVATAAPAETSHAPPNATTTPPERGDFFRRPGVILVSAALSLTVVLVASIFLSHAKSKPTEAPTPPPELVVRPVAPPPLKPVAPAPGPPPEPTVILPPATAAAPASSNVPITEKRRPVQKHHKLPITDKNGLAIPSD